MLSLRFYNIKLKQSNICVQSVIPGACNLFMVTNELNSETAIIRRDKSNFVKYFFFKKYIQITLGWFNKVSKQFKNIFFL